MQLPVPGWQASSALARVGVERECCRPQHRPPSKPFQGSLEVRKVWPLLEGPHLRASTWWHCMPSMRESRQIRPGSGTFAAKCKA
jgi:hypothetical protein